ncbi:MAG: PilZ domain-containing protein [Cyanobium sp.]
MAKAHGFSFGPADPFGSTDPLGSTDSDVAGLSAAHDTGVVLSESAAAQAREWLGHEHRRLRRFPVQASRSIALRELDAQQAPVGPWLPVDILDISTGGLSLMVSGSHQFPAGQHLLLDVHTHPGFGLPRLEVEVRWCCPSLSFTTFGVNFLEPLAALPRLELERSSELRDPSDQSCP